MPNYELVEKINDRSWKNPELQGADLSFSNIHRAQLKQADLQNANLEGATLHSADLAEANLENAYFKEARLNDAILVNSNLQGANLEHINLSDAKLENANLQGVHAPEANLERAGLRNVNLIDADLSRANLLAADLRKANLRGCNLQDADLKGIDLHEAKVDRQTNINLPANFKIVGDIIQHNPRAYIVENASYEVKSSGRVYKAGDKDAPAGDEKVQAASIPASTSSENQSIPNLYANPDDRILTSVGKPLSSKGDAVRIESLSKLTSLLEKLETLRGSDEAFGSNSKAEEIPLTSDELIILKQTVTAAIALHKLPSFPPEIINALKELMNYLKLIAKHLASIKVEKAAAWMLLLNQSWELIEKLLPMLV